MRKYTEQAMLVAIKHTEIALGSQTTLLLVVEEDSKQLALELMKNLWITVLKFEKQFSRFLPNSELSQFNKTAGPKNKITPDFRDLLLASQKMSDASDNLYNPFILPALQKAGYKNSQVGKYSAVDVDDYSKMKVVSPDSLKIGEDWASIPYGTAIDMGGCGKGYLADLLADQVENLKFIEGFWFSLGGDISGGGVDENGNPWKIYVADDEQDDLSASPYFFSDGSRFAVATSGLNFRKGVHKGKKWHHIIDPRTLEPAKTDLARVSLYGSKCLECDVFASVCLLLEGQKTNSLIKKSHMFSSAIIKPMPEAKEDPSLKYYGKNIVINQKEFTSA